MSSLGVSLIHFLTIGFLDRDAVHEGELVVLRHLPMELVELVDQQRTDLGEGTTIERGFVRLPWFRPARVRAAEMIALEGLRRGCLVADLEHARVVPEHELGESSGST